jgi:hypothetical protein
VELVARVATGDVARVAAEDGVANLKPRRTGVGLRELLVAGSGHCPPLGRGGLYDPRQR